MTSETHIVDLPYNEANMDDGFLESPVAKDNDFICPIHGRASKQAEKLKKRGQEKASSWDVKSYKLLCFGKTNFERKLEEHGLRTSEKKRGKIQPVSGYDGVGTNRSFSIPELLQLTVEELTLLRMSIKEKINLSNDYLSELNKEQGTFVSGNNELKYNATNLEETAKAVFQPWVHFLPHSDEMTRVLMLN